MKCHTIFLATWVWKPDWAGEGMRTGQTHRHMFRGVVVRSAVLCTLGWRNTNYHSNNREPPNTSRGVT